MSKGAVVITGASTGIGNACARMLDDAGFRVFAGVRKQEDADRISAQGSDRLTPLICDITDTDSLARAAEEVAAEMGEAGLAGLVNNAGIAVTGPWEFIPLEKVRRQLEVNVVGQIAATQAFMPLIRKAKGRVVHIGSIGGRISNPMGGPYTASKFAMEAVADSMRLELAPFGIRVVLIEPGAVKTEIWRKASDITAELESDLPEHGLRLYRVFIDKAMAHIPEQNRIGASAEAVGRAVLHALTASRPKSRYLVGKDAQAGAIVARFMPDPVKDWITRQIIKLPKTLPDG
ncbi:MAG: SDR family oxidoreductase [Deltaproteobacteria bacterium]|nr:SDR family oxidoreductase [Deltaproteobacteria bacterium]